MTPIDLIETAPQFGPEFEGGMRLDALEFIYTNVRAGDRIFELGCGAATILCAALRADHVCLVYEEESVRTVELFCQDHAISLGKVKMLLEDDLDFAMRHLVEGGPLSGVIVPKGIPQHGSLLELLQSNGMFEVGSWIMMESQDQQTSQIETLRSGPEWKEISSEPRVLVRQGTPSQA